MLLHEPIKREAVPGAIVAVIGAAAIGLLSMGTEHGSLFGDALALIGCPLRPRTASPLRRRVERELFSIVCDLLLVQPLADGNMLPRGADIVLRGVNARRRKRVDMGRTFDDLWTNCKQPLEEVILGFLRAESNAKTLARLGDSW